MLLDLTCTSVRFADTCLKNKVNVFQLKMENKEVKKSRARSKASKAEESSETSNSAVEEMAPNVNGDKDGGSETENATVATEDSTQEVSETTDITEVSEKGRKRKASELLDEIEKDVDTPIKRLDENQADYRSDKNDSSDLTKENSREEAEPTSENEALNSSSELISMENKIDPIDTQSLGKGKRARVPNKRYSDITPTRLNLSPKHKSSENGQIQEQETFSNENDSDGGSGVPKRPMYSSPVAHITKKMKSAVDLSNPNYLKPFKYGWKRELVYRANTDNSLKRNGDIYYYTPSGKKVRSMREVAENLNNKELSIDDFTFFKEPLGIDDPEKEIIRDAKFKTGTPSSSKKLTPKVHKAPTKAAPRSPKLSSPSTPSTADVNKVVKSPKISTGGFKVKVPKGTPSKKSKKKPDNNMEIGTYPPNWTSPSRKAKSPSYTETDSKPCRPCSIRCPGVLGLIPTLQCHICLCLYHHQCVGVSIFTKAEGYICKNCRMEHETNADAPSQSASLPPLTPLNLLNTSHPVQNPNNIPISIQSNNLPKLQRIPQESDTVKNIQSNDPLSTELPKLTPKPGLKQNYMESKGILGAVTTWFPPSSTIKVGTEVTRNTTCRPQSVEYVGNKKYLIVPRNNVLSVAPVTLNLPTEPTETKIELESHSSPASLATTPINKIYIDNIVSNQEEPIINKNSNLNENNCLDENISYKSSNSDPDEQILDNKTMPDQPIPNKQSNPDESLPDKLISPGTTIPVETLPPPYSSGQHAEVEDQLPQADEESEKAAMKAKAASKATKTKTATDATVDPLKTTDSYLQNLSYGYKTLLYVFQYLKVQDLLRAGCVCTMWRDVARHPILWNTVRMKNSQIHSFEGLANALLKHGTVHLDLRKMLLPTNGGDDIWPSFTSAIKKVESLRKIELCRCLSTVVEDLARNNHNLEAINAVTIKCETMTFEPFSNLKNLTDLRLKSTTGLSLTSDLSALKELTKLKHLSITSIKDLYKLNIEVIAELVNIEVLELGECSDFPKHFGPDILGKLDKLEKLRLEKGQGECYTFDILDSVKNIKTLYQLELVNFDIKVGFDKALGSCVNIKKLLMIPTYISQSATTNHMVLGGVLKLQKTLSHFVWGVTLELLRVTELFVDQCEQPDKKEVSKDKNITSGDSIPVLKPVPLHGISQPEVATGSTDTPQVEILPLPNLQKLLLQNLPTTRVKILKIPFHATWRQSITDSV